MFTGIEFVSGRRENLPFEDNYFDLVSSVEVLEHVPEIEVAISEMVRVSRKYVFALVPGYQKIPEVLCPCCLNSFPGAGHLHSFTSESLAKIFDESGVEVVNVFEYQHFPFIDNLIIFRKLNI